METSRRSGLWTWRIIWFVVIVGGTLASFPLVRSFSDKLRRDDARAELAQMQKMLEGYRAHNKTWPAAKTNAQLVLAFLARAQLRTKNDVSWWYLDGTNLHFRPIDPEIPGAQVIDPWGRPYVYLNRGTLGAAPASYVLFSAGVDGKYSPPRTWAPGENGAAPEDNDNICVFGSNP